MPRQAPLDAPGALQHILVRGIERRKIFRDDADRDDFLSRLGGILRESRTRCFAWALMPNHFHLLLRTGLTPLSAIMRRFLTGYAVSFNLKHRRSGHLFQNRYKSILCQEDAYLLELVRYIHLNQLRGKLVADLKELDGYGFCGHGVLLGKFRNDSRIALMCCSSSETGPDCPERGTGSLLRRGSNREDGRSWWEKGWCAALGGWKAVKALRGVAEKISGDERILGDGDFVASVLQASNEKLERRAMLQAMGYDFERLVKRVNGDVVYLLIN